MFQLLPLLIYTVLHLRKNVGFLMGLKEVSLWLQFVAKPLIYAIVSSKRLLAIFMLNHFVHISYLKIPFYVVLIAQIWKIPIVTLNVYVWKFSSQFRFFFMMMHTKKV